MRFSEKVDQLIPALHKAQKAVKPPKKSKTADIPTKSGGKFNYSYADLDAITASIKSPLEENGLMLISGTGFDALGNYGLTSRIIHMTSGQWIECFGEIDRKCTAQEQGGEQTYLRRFAPANLLNFVPEDKNAPPKEAPKVTGVTNTVKPTRSLVQPRSTATPQEQGGFNNFGEDPRYGDRG